MREKEAINDDMETALASLRAYLKNLRSQIVLIESGLVNFQAHFKNLRHQVAVTELALDDGDFIGINVVDPAQSMIEMLKRLQDEATELGNVEGVSNQIEVLKRLQDEATEFDREEEASGP